MEKCKLNKKQKRVGSSQLEATLPFPTFEAESVADATTCVLP